MEIIKTSKYSSLLLFHNGALQNSLPLWATYCACFEWKSKGAIQSTRAEGGLRFENLLESNGLVPFHSNNEFRAHSKWRMLDRCCSLPKTLEPAFSCQSSQTSSQLWALEGPISEWEVQSTFNPEGICIISRLINDRTGLFCYSILTLAFVVVN